VSHRIVAADLVSHHIVAADLMSHRLRTAGSVSEIAGLFGEFGCAEISLVADL
jgi:hypothetical protein